MTSWLRYLVFGIALLLVLWAAFGRNGMLHHWRLNRDIDRVERQIRAVEDENRQLELRVWRLQYDPVAQELAVRRELGMVAPGERVFVFPGKKP
ncbi:MAG: septum formation initiator family protein [Deltaproteobacteria bacterium]|nr:septum formation initiator family protein [Candidatus Anaeroferrophillacea bacterium]